MTKARPDCPDYQPKGCPNSNVVFELGYAFHALDPCRLIPVANESYGIVAQHFFDVHHRRHPIRFWVDPDTSPDKRRKTQHSLQHKLIRAIRNVIESHGTSRPPALHYLYSDWWNTQTEHRVSTSVHFEGLDFWVEQGVFSPEPRLTNSSSLVARKIQMPFIEGKRVLDLGTGSGALAVLAALRGAKQVVAVDFDPRAVNNAQYNVEKHNVKDRVTVIESNLFDEVTGTFDVIIANLPIDPHHWEHAPDEVGEIARKFLSEVRTYLAPKGLALLPWASFGEEIALTEMLNEAKLRFQIHTEETFGVTWQLYEIRDGLGKAKKGESQESRA